MRQVLPLLLLAVLPAVAQEEPGEQGELLYRVEVIMFANRDPEAAASEAWLPEPELAYPPHWQTLGSGDARRPADREYRLLRVEDTVPEIFDLFWDRSVDELWAEYRLKRLTPPETAPHPLDVPGTMIRLPAEQRELNTQRRRIDDSAGLDVLFHESWLQRMRSEDESLPILIDTPQRFGDFPEIQGSILLYIGRYLHIATNLWLNTDGRYLDAPESWQMPAPPLPPDPTEPPLQPFRVDPAPDWLKSKPYPVRGQQNTHNRRGQVEAIPVAATVPQQAPAGEIAREADETEAIPAGDAGAPGRAVSGWLLTSALTHSPEPAADYEFRHAVVIRQQRRMRSNELHYIDHPMLGIVIKITRHEFEPFATPAGQDPTLAGMR
jgi:hypothetical protein